MKVVSIIVLVFAFALGAYFGINRIQMSDKAVTDIVTEDKTPEFRITRKMLEDSFVELSVSGLNKTFKVFPLKKNSRKILNQAKDKPMDMRIDFVKPGSLFDKAGLQYGDIITKINGKDFTFNDMVNMFKDYNLYKKFEYTILRYEKEQTHRVYVEGSIEEAKPETEPFVDIEIWISSETKGDTTNTIITKEKTASSKFYKLKDLAAILTQARGIPIKNPDGTLFFKLVQIEPESMFQAIGIFDGDIVTHIDDKKIKNMGEIIKRFGGNNIFKDMKLTIQRNKEVHYINIDMQ